MIDIVWMADPRVAAIPVADCGEPLSDLRDAALARVRIDDRLADATGAWRRLRRGVVDRLGNAAAQLPAGVGLLVIEGYRPPHLQAAYFQQYLDTLTALHPGHGPEDLRMLASRFISPPDIAPHSAGAAVDLTLCTDAGEELDLGTVYDATPEESDGACFTAADNISDDARAMREMLGAAMSGAGFVNYPTEWWHWSFGDRYWALMTDAPAAVYGPTQ